MYSIELISALLVSQSQIYPSNQRMKYLTDGVGFALLVPLILAVAHGTLALFILAHPAVQPLCEPNKGCQTDGDYEVFHNGAGSFWTE